MAAHPRKSLRVDPACDASDDASAAGSGQRLPRASRATARRRAEAVAPKWFSRLPARDSSPATVLPFRRLRSPVALQARGTCAREPQPRTVRRDSRVEFEPRQRRPSAGSGAARKEPRHTRRGKAFCMRKAQRHFPSPSNRTQRAWRSGTYLLQLPSVPGFGSRSESNARLNAV